MANEFIARKGLIALDNSGISGSLDVSGSLTIESSGSTIFEVIGSEGQLFSITDSLSGSLFAVSDVSGLPILEVFSDDTVKIGSFNNEAITVSGSHTTIGGTLAIPGFSDISASLAANSIPAGTISGSAQVDHDATTNFSADEHFTQANITTVGTVTSGDVSAILPAGTVSGSSQIDLGSATGTAANATNASTASYVSGSNVDGTVALATSALNAINATNATYIDVNNVSGNTEYGLVFRDGNGDGNQALYADNETDQPSYNPSTNTIKTPIISASSALYVGGNITVTGNVDGVDVATLKSDFDTLSGNTTGTNTGDQDLSSYSTIAQLNASSSALQSNIDAKASIAQLNASSSALQSNIDTNTSNIATLTAATSSYLTSVPAGTISSSAQITITESQISDLTHYTDSDVKTKLNTETVVSGSASNVKSFLNISSADISDVDAFSQSGTYASLRAQGTTAGDVGLGNVTNESKATMFTSPTFTGTTAAPTPSTADDSTKIATTAYVQANLDNLIGNAGAALDTLGELSASLADATGSIESLVTEIDGKLAKSSNLSDLTNAATARTNLGVDAAGTDNSTDVTLAGSYDYITISGQTITRNQVDASTDISNLTTANVSEVTNLYYTDARVKTKLNAESVVSGSATQVRSFLNVENGADVTDTTNVQSALSNQNLNLGTGNLTASNLDISGDVDIDGTLEADAITVNGTALSSVIASTTVVNAANAVNATNVNVIATTDNADFFVTVIDGASSDQRIESSTKLKFNPSTGNLFVDGNITSSGNVDIQGTLSLPGFSDVSASLAAAVAGGDDLGNHTATQNLDMGTYAITNVGNVDGVDVSTLKSDFDTLEGKTLVSGSSQITHDSTTGFVANEHIDHSTVSITAGSGLTGGGTIAATRTINIGAGDGISVAADSVAVDATVLRTTGDSVVSSSVQVTHDSTTGFVANEHIDHSTVSITAGNGLTGGGTIASTRTLNVGAGDGISVAADSVAVDATVLRTTGDGVISSSAQIDHDATTNFNAAEHFTQANITTVGTVTSGDVSAILPSGTVSGSSQINLGSATGTVDISSQTNLVGGTNLTLSGDTMNLDANISLTNITASGNISASGYIYGTPLVGANEYAFRYTNNGTIYNTGLFFSQTNGQYEFLDGSSTCVFCIKAGSGNTTIYGNLTASSDVDIQGVLSLPGFSDVSSSLAAAVAGGDNLGNHTATQNLNMGTYAITNVGNVDGVDVSALNTTVSTNTSNIATLTAATSSYLTSVPAGTISSSAQVNHDATTNFSADEHFTQANITTVGTIGTGVWQGTAIADGYISSATTWNNKLDSAGTITTNDYAKFDASGDLTGRSYSEVKTDLSLNNVTNESKATMFTSPTFTGTVAIPGFADVSASLAAAGGGSGISNIVEDTTPQLGGNLDVNGYSFTGANNSTVTVGNYPVGYDQISFSGYYITGSGLIVSGAQGSNYHNFLKIGQTEMIDVVTGVTNNLFLIHNVDDFAISSGSDSGNITTNNLLFRHSGDSYTFYRDGSTAFQHTNADALTFTATSTTFASDTTYLKAPSQTLGSTTYLLVTNGDPSTAPTAPLKSIRDSSALAYLGGALTASAIAGTITEFDTGSSALSSNGGSLGDIVKFGGSTTVAGGLYYLNSSGGWTLAQSNAANTSTGSLAVALGTNSTTDGMLLRGFVNPFSLADAGIGAPVYVASASAGRFSGLPSQQTGEVVRVVGHAYGNDLIYFNPSNNWIEL